MGDKGAGDGSSTNECMETSKRGEGEMFGIPTHPFHTGRSMDDEWKGLSING